MKIVLANKQDGESIAQLLIKDADAYKKLAVMGIFDIGNNDLYNATFVAKSTKGQVVGFIKISLYSNVPHAYIGGIYVLPNNRKKGLGKKLMTTALSFADMSWHTMFISGCTLNNPASEALFESMGFKNMGVHKKKYFNHGWIDETYWQKQGNI